MCCMMPVRVETNQVEVIGTEGAVVFTVPGKCAITVSVKGHRISVIHYCG